eukprot:7443750-Pyramimonas_sp.AAC.1
MKQVRPSDPWVLDKVPAEPISASRVAKILYIDTFGGGASSWPSRGHDCRDGGRSDGGGDSF